MLVLCLVAALAVQDPTSPEGQPSLPVVEEWDDARARNELSTFRRTMRSRKATSAERAAAVEALARGRNERLIDAFADVVEGDPSPAARRAAAAALGFQPMEKSRRAVRKLLRDDELEKEPELLGLLVGALDRNGYEADEDWRMLEELFVRDYGMEWVPLKKAIIALAENHREDRALEMLVEGYAEPIPEDVHDPSNPPAEYWERRWKEWAVWKPDVRRALRTMSGQDFEDAKAARAWLEEHRSKKKSG